MKKDNLYVYLSAGLIAVLAIALAGVLLYMKNQPPQPRGIPDLTSIADMEPDNHQWGINFPNQFSTFLKTETNATATTFGGSSKVSKLEQDPRLLVLFDGYGFSKEYNEDRGHMNSLTDVRTIKRVNETTPGTCHSSKSSKHPRL